MNGKYPVVIANSNTPSAHISAGGPEYSSFYTICGDMYDGVPQNILTFISFGMQVENPKSIIFIFPFSSMRRLSSLMSR